MVGMNNHCTVAIPWHSQALIIYYSMAPAIHEVSMTDLMIDVKSDGRVMWLSPLVIISHCDFNVRRFPYDKQTCEFTIGSWSHDGRYVDFRNRNPYGKNIHLEDKFMLQLSGESDRMKVKLFLMFLSFMHWVLSRHVSNVSGQWSSPRKHQIYNSTKHWGGLDTYQWYEDNEPPSLIKEQKWRSIGKMIKLLPDSLFSTLTASIVLNKLQNDWYDAFRSTDWLTLLTLAL